jgi:hypothetical protein
MKLAQNIVQWWGWKLRISNFRLKKVEGVCLFLEPSTRHVQIPNEEQKPNTT